MAPPTSRHDGAGAALPQPLRAADLLHVWEQSRGEAKVARALTILTRGLPSEDRDSLADLPIGARDVLLLRLREASFGPHADCVARCPACAAAIEFAVPVCDLVVEPSAESEGVVEWNGMRLRVRAATSRDQLSLAGLDDPGAMAERLLKRCAAVEEAPGFSRDVPAAAIDAVAAEMARLDPGADLRFTLSCPSCATTWTSLFDVTAYVWREVEAAARALLADVHALASAYGWSEAEILGLTPGRRRAYLELVGAR